MMTALLGAVAFLVLVVAALVVVGALTPDSALEPPHPPKCDCMTCGRKAAERKARGWR